MVPLTAIVHYKFTLAANVPKEPVPPPRTNAPSKTLDEITNKVYEDILQEKSENAFAKQKSDKGSVKVSVCICH